MVRFVELDLLKNAKHAEYMRLASSPMERAVIDVCIVKD